MQTIIKIESRVEVRNGISYTVYKRSEYSTKDKGYCLELLKQKAFQYNQSKKPLQLTPAFGYK
jgi:hypothetical protein